MFAHLYHNSILKNPKAIFTLLIIAILSFGYYSKDFRLDASSETLLIEGDPDLAYLRESGSIEQDADVVMFVYREGYYLQRKEPREATVEHAEWQAKMNEVAHLAQIIIGKQRHGPIGNVTLEFEERFTKFKDTQTN